MMSNGINKQHSQHHQRWDKANTNAADWGGTWESGGKLLGEACSPRPKQEKGREGKGSRRQPPLSHVNLWNYLHTVKSTGRRGLTAHCGLLEITSPFLPSSFMLKSSSWSNTTTFSSFCSLEVLSRGKGGRETAPCQPPAAVHCALLCQHHQDGDPGPVGHETSTAPGAGSVTPSAFPEAAPAVETLLGRVTLAQKAEQQAKKTWYAMAREAGLLCGERTLLYTQPSAASSLLCPGSGMPGTATGFCIRLPSVWALMGLQLSATLGWQHCPWQPAWRKEELPHNHG